MTKQEILRQIQRQIRVTNKDLSLVVLSLKAISDMVKEVIIKDDGE